MTNILHIIVLYHCKLQDSITYKTFEAASEKQRLLVFDNSEQPQDIEDTASEAVYIHNESNIGLSACYNKAAIYAKEHGYQWLLFLDQDTDFSGVTIGDYEKAIEENSGCKMMVPLVKCGEFTMSPMNFKHHFAVLSNKIFSGKQNVKDISVINSGMCVSLDAFEKCGGYNEKVFLDYSDHEFVGRYKKHFEFLYVLPKVIRQDFSSKTDSKESSLRRFGLFCQSLSGCEKEGTKEACEYAFVIVKRMLSLMLCFRTTTPCFIAYKNYFEKR